MRSETGFPPDLRALENDYELIRELGQGGMAAVYLARRRESGTLVAVKAIRARYVDDPNALQRFAREARTVADLSHPNIVRTEAIEEIGDRAVAIIMEYFADGTVRDRLREYGAFSAEHTESVLRDVANALGYAHRRGIVHRDVKPENIFLEKATGRALLSDFGIARRIEGEAPLTLAGAALGTPQYMSPEQIDGVEVDGRTDIYSLGVLGWELLTGHRPWAGDNLYGIIYKQKHEELPRITSLRPRVPANLLFAIEGAMVKDRERRWQSIDQFLEHLTYAPPPVLAQHRPVAAALVDTEPTVKFRRTATPPRVVPNDAPVVPGPVNERILPHRRAPGGQPTTPRGHDGAVHSRLPRALALVVPLALAAASAYVLFGDRPRDAASPDGSAEVTLSAGAVVLDTARRADSASARSSASVPVSKAATPPQPLPQPSPRPFDTARQPRPSTAKRADTATVLTRVARQDSVAGAAPTGRCEKASIADQRACLLAYVTANDVALQRVYDSLIVEMRRNAHTGRRAPDPTTVRQLRVEQRSWVVDRDRECTSELPPGSVALWARPLAECFSRISAARETELRAVLARARRNER